MAASLTEQALNLPIEDRRRLVDDIWASIDAETPAEALTSDEEKLLDERSADYRRNPDGARPWAQVRDSISGTR